MCLKTTEDVAFRQVARRFSSQIPALNTDTAVVQFDNRTRRELTHGPSYIIKIIRNSDVHCDYGVFTLDINNMRAYCYVGVRYARSSTCCVR